MAQETRTEAKARAATSPELFQLGAERLESLLERQKQLLDAFEQIQRDRISRMIEETEFASDLAARVSKARTVPDIMTVHQEWISRRVEMLAEDGRKFLDDSQNVANAMLRMLASNGRTSGT
jgi:hypothetical protein